MKKLLITKGTKFNYLTIIEEDFSKKTRHFKCKCVCWKETVTDLWALRKWKQKSCWCFRNNIFTTHWLSWTRFYYIYFWIRQRCENPKKDVYKHYWREGIKCEWKTFEEFKNDMYESYLKHCEMYWIKNTTIDRKENHLNYCKDNCRWATYNVQQNNRSNNRIFTYNWITKTLSQWIKDLWLNKNTVTSRLYKLKWSMEKSLWLKE